MSLDGQFVTPVLDVPATGGWQNWQYLTASNIYLSAGTHKFQTRFFFGGYNFSYLDFVLIATDVDDETNNPISFMLEQNYPNPFNPNTVISYSVPEQSNVKLSVYDVLGNEVKTLVNENKNPGKYYVEFDGKDLSSGVYYYNIQVGNYSDVKKMILMK